MLERITRWMEDLPGSSFVALVALLASPGLAPLLLEGPAGLALGALAIPTGFLAGAGAMSRRLASSLPLVIAEPGLVEQVNGVAHYRFRVRLGRGRTMRQARARILWHGPDGTVELEPVLASAEALVGPWTLLVIDEAGIAVGDGRFEVWVGAKEDGREWAAAATWERGALQAGRFAAPLEGSRGKWVWGTWDAVAPGQPC